MNTVKRILKSSALRWAFLVIALGFLGWAIAKNWSSLIAALTILSGWIALLSVLLAIVYVFFTLLSWKTLLKDLGTDLAMNPAIQLFGVSQIGKYIPGGVWNIVAAAQIGRRHQIPAHRSVAAMTMAVLISLLSGVGLGVVTLLGTSTVIQVPTWVIVVLFLFLCIMLTPPILNRLIKLAFTIARRPEVDLSVSFKGLSLSTLYAVIAWGIAGIQIWVLAAGFGMELSVSSFFLSIGAYALAWVVGFIVVFVPAGTGVRESVISLFLAGSLGSGGILATVLVSRIAMTVADLAFAGAGALLRAHEGRNKQED